MKTGKQKSKSAHVIIKNSAQTRFKLLKPDIISYALLSIISLLFVLMCYQNNHLQDDAFITFRYVENIVSGHGLVFNPGERVEGFTSILWVFILVVIRWLGLDLPGFSQIAGLAFGIISIWLTFFLTKIFFGKFAGDSAGSQKSGGIFSVSDLRILPSAMLAFTGAFQYWSISGMEVTFFISLALLSIYLYLTAIQQNKSLILFSAGITLTSLVRPEAILIFCAIIIHYWFSLNSNNEESKPRSFILKIFGKPQRDPILFFAGANLVLLLFRLGYYGYPLPNTFYAKTGFSQDYLLAGLNYLGDFVKTYLLWGAVLIVSLFPLIKHEIRSYLLPLLAIVILFFAYTIFVGGDVLPLFRFVLPVLPLIYILFVAGLFLLLKFITGTILKSGTHFAAALTILIAVGLTYYNYAAPQDRIEKYAFYENQLVDKMRGTGNWLAKNQSVQDEKLVVAATTIGAVSFYSGTRVIDMLGLTDGTIAHHPKPLAVISGKSTGWKERNYNVEYLLSQKPDFIYFSTGIKPSAYAERALFLSEDFINNYYPYYFNPVGNFVETIYKRKSGSGQKENFIPFSANPVFDSNYVNLYNELLNIKSKPGNSEKAYLLCRQIEKVGPLNFTGAQYQLGLLYEKDRNKRKAVETMSLAAGKDEYQSLAHFYLGKHYARENDYQSAQRHFELVEKYNPDFFEYQTRLRSRLQN